MSEERLYLEADDALDVGDWPREYKDSKMQAMHDHVKKNRKQILEQYKKQGGTENMKRNDIGV